MVFMIPQSFNINEAVNNLTPDSYDKEKAEFLKKITNLASQLQTIHPSKKTLEKLQTAVQLIKEKADTDVSQDGKKIQSLAGNILKQVDDKLHPHLFEVPKAAAKLAEAFKAAAHLKEAHLQLHKQPNTEWTKQLQDLQDLVVKKGEELVTINQRIKKAETDSDAFLISAKPSSTPLSIAIRE